MNKKRKPRTTGKEMVLDGLAHINNHPFRFDTIAEQKIHTRLVEGNCPACGKKKCNCLSRSQNA
jgi:hypothetical protein